MKPLYRNLFLLFGVVAIVIMLLSFDVDYRMIGSRMGSALAYLPLVIGVWVAVYACNAWAFQMIVNASDHDKHLDFRTRPGELCWAFSRCHDQHMSTLNYHNAIRNLSTGLVARPLVRLNHQWEIVTITMKHHEDAIFHRIEVEASHEGGF